MKKGGRKEGDVRFQQTHYQDLHQLLLTVSWDRHIQRITPDGILVSL